MHISLFKDPSSRPGDILAHVEVSLSDDPPNLVYSHSFRYKVPSGKDGEIIIYISKDAASKDVKAESFSFDLEKCRNKECKEKNPNGCPVIADKPHRVLVADVFHTMPTQNTIQYFGTALFRALFSGDAGSLLQETKPTHQNGPIFLQLNDQDLDDIPWEYAKDGTTFLVHRRKFARILALPLAPPQEPLPKLPLHIVVAVPDPLDLTELSLADLHLGDQFQNFINEFRENSINVMLERVLPATVNRMNSLLAKHNDKLATVLHFMGHCVARQDNKKVRGLLFEDGETFKCVIANTQNLVTVPANLRLAFLSACDSREVARDLVQNGIRQTIGSYCPLPDDIARKSEAQFYHYLAQGLSVDEAIWRTRLNFQDSKELRQSDYLAGAMIIYSANCQTTDNIFLCESGELKIEMNMFTNNLDIISSPKIFFGRKKQLVDLCDILRRMATRTNDSFDLCTVTSIAGQGKTTLVKEATQRTGHFFPGGIFVWQFDDNKEISATDYLRSLVDVLFPKDFRNSTENVEILGQAISNQFNQVKASTLLILDHADSLTRAAAEAKEDAVFLVNWFQRIISRKEIAVKILATSQQDLGWLGEKRFSLDGFTDSDIHSGCKLFIENLSLKAKTKMQKEKGSKPLLRELVSRMDGHPLSLKLLANAAGLPEYLNKPLEDIVYKHCEIMLADADAKKKELKEHFSSKIDILAEMDRLFLYVCSLVAGPITAEVLALVCYLVDYKDESVETINYSVDSIREKLEQFCEDGYLFKKNDTYKLHIGFKEGLRQHNEELKIRLPQSKFGLVDDAFAFGIPSDKGKSNVLEWQLHNLQSNADNRVERTFGIQYRNIVNTPDTNNHELKVSLRGLVVFVCETYENFLDDFAEVCVKQIKPIVEKKGLPFILCFKHTDAKMAGRSAKKVERNILLKRVTNALQGELTVTHLVIRTEPLPVSNNNANVKKTSTKMNFKSNLAAVHTYGDFFGRGEELKQLKELLNDNEVRYITILGFGGMGKTTLAVQAVKNFNSGKVLALSFVKNPSFNSVISKIAEFLNIHIKHSSESEDLEIDVLQKLADEDTVLLYLDNMETLKQAAENKNSDMEKERKEARSIIRFFNQTPSNVKILATSRVVLEWPGEQLIKLMGLEPQEGMQVFRQWASLRLDDFSDEDAKKISYIASGHPLSIRLLGGAFNKCGTPINEFIDNITEQLKKAKDSLDQRYDSVDACIQYSYDYMDDNLKHFLGQLRLFNVPFSVTLVSKILGLKTTSALASSTKDNLHILYQQSWLDGVKYDSMLGDWRPRFMENDTLFYTLHPRIRDFLDHQFQDIKVTDIDDADMQFYTSLCYAVGFGVVNDLEKQIEWCEKAAKNSHLEAQLSLAVCYEEGAGTIATDARKAFYWYLKAAERGDKVAQSKVYDCYRDGKGVDKDTKSADNWWRLLKANETKPLEIKFDLTLSLVHRAAENNQVDLVRLLIGHGSVEADIRDRHRRTPLHLAAEKGHIEVVKLLAIEFNAETNAKDKSERTPLYVAASNGHINVVRLLVAELGADVSTKGKSKEGKTLLHVAAGIHIFRLLVAELGGDVNGIANTLDKYGKTPLYCAAMNGHIEIMKMLRTELGADIRTKDINGATLLHVASRIDVIRLLLAELGDDVNVNVEDKIGRTPLHYAAQNGRFDVMKMLIVELGADKDKKDKKGGTLLHYAAKGGNVNVVSSLVTELGADTSSEDSERRTPLHWAAKGGQVEVVKLLMLRMQPRMLTFEFYGIGVNGTRALTEALKQNTTLTELNLQDNIMGPEGARILSEYLRQNTTLIELNLGDNGIGINGAYALAEALKQNTTLTKLNLLNNTIGAKGACALAESLEENTTLIELILLSNEIDDEGASALAESLKHNTTLLVLNLYMNKICIKGARTLARSLKQNKILTKLNLGVNDIGEEGTRVLVESLKQNMTLIDLDFSENEIDDESTLALTEFLNRNNAFTKLFEIMKLGVVELEWKANTNVNNSRTQPHIAELLKALTEFGKDSNVNYGLTPLHIIVAHGHIGLVKLLEGEFGADVNTPDNNGWTPLHIAAARGYVEIVRLLVTKLGANPKAKDNNGRTPFHSAADNGYGEVVKRLITEHGIDVNAKDNHGQTPLHLAAQCGSIDVVKLLVAEFGADANARDNEKLTPLHLASMEGHVEMVKQLAGEFSADVNAKSNNGYTSLHYAAKEGDVNMVTVLVRELGADLNAESKNKETPLVTAAKHDQDIIVDLIINELETNGKKPRRKSKLDKELLWKTTAVVVSTGAVVCIVWLLWVRTKTSKTA